MLLTVSIMVSMHLNDVANMCDERYELKKAPGKNKKKTK